MQKLPKWEGKMFIISASATTTTVFTAVENKTSNVIDLV